MALARIKELVSLPTDPCLKFEAGLTDEEYPHRARLWAEEVERVENRERKREEAQLQAAAEQAAKKEAAEKAAREAAEEAAAKRAAEEKALELLAQSGGLRKPRKPLILPVDDEWLAKAQKTQESSSNVSHAKTGEGSDLRRHDFASVMSPQQWLNDEIINGTIIWIDRAVNEAAGITDTRRQTRKCLAMNSFFFKDLLAKGPVGTERKLRRNGVNKSNMLDVESILLPVCEGHHWTLVVIRPKHRTVAHVDSLQPIGNDRYTRLTMDCVKHVLEEKFEASEWKVVRYEAPRQENGYDCGVFTITNALCLALGLSPALSYQSNELETQRVRIASVLLNGGFKGDFDLKEF